MCLGDLNDIVVNQRFSASLVNSATTSERDNNAAWKAFAAGRLCGREEGRLSSVMKAATRAYKAFAGAKRFWNERLDENHSACHKHRNAGRRSRPALAARRPQAAHRTP